MMGFIIGKERLLKDLRRIEEDPKNNFCFTSDLELFFNDEIIVSEGLISELDEIDDPAVKAAVHYLKWIYGNKRDFSHMRNCFLWLDRAIDKYLKMRCINVASFCFKIFISKGIKLNQIDPLKVQLRKRESLLDSLHDLKFCIQDRILRSFTDGLEYIAKKGALSELEQIYMKVYQTITNLAEYYQQNARRNQVWGSYCSERHLLELKLKLSKLIRKNEVDAIRLRIAETYEDEGDLKEVATKGIGVLSYAMAFMYYLNLGAKNKLENIKIKLRKSACAFKSNLKEVKVDPINIPIEQIVKKIISNIDSSIALKSFVNSPEIYPIPDKIENAIVGNFAQLFPCVYIDDEGNVSAILEEISEKKKRAFFLQMAICEEILKTIRIRVFNYLLEKGFFSKQDILDVFNHPSLNNKTIKLIQYGIQKHFDGDYISSCHILILQIESVVRVLIREKTSLSAIVPKTNRKGATQEITLGALLEKTEVQSLFNDYFLKYLELYFIYDLGFNLRNEIAHGLVRPEYLDEGTSLAIIIILLRLLFMLD